MTVLKWLVVLASVGYLGGLAVLYLKQRDFVFPIPRTVAARLPKPPAFPEAEEHVLTTAGWREGHHLARSGKNRAIRS